MILDKTFINKIIEKRNLNLLINGTNTHINYFGASNALKQSSTKVIKSHLVNLLSDICISPNYYSKSIQKNLIIILNCQYIPHTYFQKVKSLIDSSYISSTFIFHTTNSNIVGNNIKSRCLTMTLPIDTSNHINPIIQLSYNKIIKTIQKPLSTTTISTIREICYMYYMSNESSQDLQKLFVINIGRNYYLPNSIKYDILSDICDLNKLYQYSYRKPIFLECMIYSLFKHLDHYTTNL